MEHVSGKGRFQIELRCLDELVEEDSPARQIDGVVDVLDTSYFLKATPKDTGRPPYNPKDMLKLFLYGMDNGVASSRRLCRECRRNIEVMWLLNGLKPDDKTICNFRHDNAEQIKRFFDEFVKYLKNGGYIDGKVVSIDGTKIRANNSKRNNYSVKKLNGLIERIDNKIAEYLDDVDKNDKMEELQARKAEYELYKARIESGEVSEVSTTDPDSRLMRQGNNGVDVSYNVETAVDSKNKLIAGVLVTNEPNDQGQLYKVAKSVKDNLELEEITSLGDKGFYDTDDFKDCHEDGITTIVAKPREKTPKKEILNRSEFEYNREKDCYRCPAGQTLPYSTEESNGNRKYRNPKACKNCPLKEQCTTSKYRCVSRHKYAEYAEQNDLAFAENYDLYKLRQQLSEHPFGTAKRSMGMRQFLTKGITGVTAEAALLFFAYNLKRLRVIHKDGNKKDGQTVQFARLFIILLLFRIFYVTHTKTTRNL